MKPMPTAMKPTIILATILACARALAPGLAAQNTTEVSAQPTAEFRMLIRPARTSGSFTRDTPNTASAVFSDPKKPGTLKINDAISHVEIQGVEDNEVTVSSALALKKTRGNDGEDLRLLNAVTNFELVEKDNVISLNISQVGDSMKSRHDFKIRVPRSTNIIIETDSKQFEDRVTIADIDGDVDVYIGSGDVALKNTTGAITIGTLAGAINVALDKAPQKDITLSNMQGNIDLALPVDATANVRMGAIYSSGSVRTNFPKTALGIVTNPDETFSWGNAKFEAEEAAIRERIDRRLQELRQERESNAATPATGSSNATVATGTTEKETSRLDAIRAEIARRRQERDGDATVLAITSSNRGKSAATMPSRASFSARDRVITGELNGGGIDIRLITGSGTITLKQAR